MYWEQQRLPVGSSHSMMKSTCSWANEGLVLVRFCGPISDEGAGMFHCVEGHLDGLQYKYILKNVMVPYVRQLYSSGVFQFWQDHSFIHDSYVLQEWPLLQDSVELSGHHKHRMWTSWRISEVGEENHAVNLAISLPLVACVWDLERSCFMSASRLIPTIVYVRQMQFVAAGQGFCSLY
jgi:hypothetical protein